jgi:hypothetical protein
MDAGNKQMRLNVSSTLNWFGLDNSNMDTGDRRVYYCPSASSYPPYYFRVPHSSCHLPPQPSTRALTLIHVGLGANADQHVARVLWL